jgi:hypothetical protein
MSPVLSALLFLGAAAAPVGGFVEGHPDRIWAVGEAPAGLKDESLAREAAGAQARANLARVAAAVGKLCAPDGKVSATLTGSEIVSVECKKTCRARAEVGLADVTVARRGKGETLDAALTRAFPDDRDGAMRALDAALAKKHKKSAKR